MFVWPGPCARSDEQWGMNFLYEWGMNFTRPTNRRSCVIESGTL